MSFRPLKFRLPKVALLLALGSISVAGAQSGSPPLGGVVLNETQLHGMQLFVQSCATCHGATLFAAENHNQTGIYGPLLWSGSLGGNEASLAAFISAGSAAMPGFGLTFSAAQIAAIVDFLKVLPQP